MSTRLLIFLSCLALLVSRTPAATPLEFQRAITSGTHHSLSGQFLVHDEPPTTEYTISPADYTNLVRLEPSLLPVSCERIKKTLLEILGARDQWRDRIVLNLHYTFAPNEPIVITPLRFENDWLYRMDVPDLIDRPAFVSALVHVLLLEIANRNTAQSTEIPAWFVQGMSREVQLSAQGELVVGPPDHTINHIPIRSLLESNRRTDPLADAHEELRTIPPLTLDQLSWPADYQFYGQAAKSYRASSQLFVHSLLDLRDGHIAMQNLLRELPQHLNWQIAFLQAFHADFASQRELEKWWALNVVQFTGRDLTQTWPSDESWYKLDETLHQTVQIRSGINDMPMRSQVTLETIIHDWDAGRQKQFLREKSQQLSVLRLRVSQDMVYLVDDYRRVLDHYLNRKDNRVYIPMAKSIYPPQLDDLARDTLQQLAILETRRAQLRPKPAPVSAPATASISAR